MIRKCFKKRFTLHALLTLLVVVIMSEFAYATIRLSYVAKEKKNMEVIIQDKAKLIKDSISEKIFTVENMDVLLQHTDYDTEDFYNWAPILFRAEPDLYSIQLAPGGIIQHIYPITGNEKAIGYNMLSVSPRNLVFDEKSNDSDITFIGPIKLVQNEKQSLIAKKALYKKEGDESKFWGFAIVVIAVEDLQISNILEDTDYSYKLIGYNPNLKKMPVIYSSPEAPVLADIEHPIHFHGGTCMLQMSVSKNPLLKYLHLGIYILLIIAGYFYLHEHNKLLLKTVKIHELNDSLRQLTYTDDLTGLFNRRGIYEELTKLMKTGNFSVALMDLDKFKAINDTYGHALGDAALKHVCSILKYYLKDLAMIGRIGGDEFIIVFPESSPLLIDGLIKDLLSLIKNTPLIYKDKEIILSGSIGSAHYSHGESLENLIARADKNMYTQKKEHS